MRWRYLARVRWAMKKREIHDGRKFPIFIHSELDDLGLDPFTFRIYGRLARRAGERGAFESVPNMAKHCKMSERQVRYSLKILLQLNLIRKTEHPGKPANYTLTDLPEWKNPQEETTKEQPEDAPAPDAPLHHMQPTPAPYAGLPLHHMQPKVIHDKGTPIKRESTPPISKSIISVLIAHYKDIANDYKSQMALKNQAMLLEGKYQVADLEAWLASRKSLSSIGFIASDFKTWLANQSRQKTNGQQSDSPRQITKAPIEYLELYRGKKSA